MSEPASGEPVARVQVDGDEWHYRDRRYEVNLPNGEYDLYLGAAPPAASGEPAEPAPTALERFHKHGADEETDPVERLRAFCSLAMKGQDWIDVEPFFDALATPAPVDVEALRDVIAEPLLGAKVDAYYLPTEKPYGDEIKIQRSRQMDGSVKWAVRLLSQCLTKSGEWEWEPMPSSRDDKFLARCRFDSAEDAIRAALSAQPRSEAKETK